MLTATMSHSAVARIIKDSWPAWSAPMVGTSPTVRPSNRAASRAWRNPTTVWTTSISDPRPDSLGLLRRPVLGRFDRGPGPSWGRPFVGQAVGRFHASVIAGPLVLGQRPSVPLEVGPIPPGRWARQRRRRTQASDIVDRGARQIQERVDVEVGRRRDPLDLPEERHDVVRGDAGGGVIGGALG